MADGVANGPSTATVLTMITATASQNLNFGQIFGGTPKSMGYNKDDSSAIFTVTGQPSAGINLELILPEYLSLANGSARMPVIFSTTDAAIDTTTVTPSTVGAGNGWINRNPHSLPAAVVGSGGTTKLYLGGKVVPSVDQKAGSYSGDIVLSVSYTGS